MIGRTGRATVQEDFGVAALLLTSVIALSMRVVVDLLPVTVQLRRFVLTGSRIDATPSRRTCEVHSSTRGRGRTEDALLHNATCVDVSECAVLIHATAGEFRAVVGLPRDRISKAAVFAARPPIVDGSHVEQILVTVVHAYFLDERFEKDQYPNARSPALLARLLGLRRGVCLGDHGKKLLLRVLRSTPLTEGRAAERQARCVQICTCATLPHGTELLTDGKERVSQVLWLRNPPDDVSWNVWHLLLRQFCRSL